MIATDKIPKESTLLDEKLKDQLRTAFSKLEEKVVLKTIINLENDKDRELAGFLGVISTLSDKILVEYYDIREKDEVGELDINYMPVVGMYKNNIYSGVTYHGVPGGQEINSFVYAIYNLSGPGQEIEKKLVHDIQKIDYRVNIKICVSLSCHHCPKVVTACQRMAILNENIEAEMIDATLFKELVKKYNIERVPVVIINDQDVYIGPKTIEDMIRIVKK